MASVDFQVAVKGDLEGFSRDLLKAQQKVATNVNRKAARRTRKMLRKVVKGALGSRRRVSGAALEDTIIFKDFPKRGYAFDNESKVYSVARYFKGRSVQIDLLTVLNEGAEIDPKGNWLWLPTKDAPLKVGRGGRVATPREYPGPKQFIRVRDTLALYIDPGRRLVLWVGVKHVSQKKRIDADGIHAASSARMAEDFKNLYETETVALVQKYNLAAG